jgi:hypothetical protein
MYNVVEVIGSEMPSKNAKYVGATPSMALSKAAQNPQEESYEAQVFGPHAACVTQAFREGAVHV